MVRMLYSRTLAKYKMNNKNINAPTKKKWNVENTNNKMNRNETKRKTEDETNKHHKTHYAHNSKTFIAKRYAINAFKQSTN